MSKETKAAEAAEETAEVSEEVEGEAEAAADTEENAETEEADMETAVKRIYIGPSINGVVQTGTVFKGELTPKLKSAIEDCRVIGELIVTMDQLQEKKRELATAGSAIQRFYAAAGMYKVKK